MTIVLIFVAALCAFVLGLMLDRAFARNRMAKENLRRIELRAQELANHLESFSR